MMTRKVLLNMELEEDDDEDGDIVLENFDQTIVCPTFGSLENQQDFRTPEFEEFNGKPDSLFFTDGQRRIDFILVYEDESKRRTIRKGQMRNRRGKDKHTNLTLSAMGCSWKQQDLFLMTSLCS